jgi:AmiR/NasT family two-component response regulator
MKLTKERRRVVVVSADSVFCSALIHLLEKTGYAAERTADLQQALTPAASGWPALLILDVDTPCGRAVQPTEISGVPADIPFIVLSRRHDETLARYALETGAMSYLVRSADAAQCFPAARLAISHAEELRQLRDQARHLSTALQQGRAVSMAIGVLIERLRLNRDEAFETLRSAARTQRRRLDEVAIELLRSVESINSATAARLDTAPEVPQS